MANFYESDGTQFEGLKKGGAFSAYLSSLQTKDFPIVMGKHTFGKKLIAFGDSLTAYSGGDGRVGDGFLSQANRTLGMEITPMGYAGSNWTSSNIGDAPARIQKLIDDGIAYDVVTLAWGTNGDANNGTVDDAPSKTGSMCAVMKWAVNAIRERYPYTSIGIIIPPQGASAMNESSGKADLMIDCCRHPSMRVPYLDLYHEGQITVTPIGTGGLANDQVHLYGAGVYRYASAYRAFVERICPCITHD